MNPGNNLNTHLKKRKKERNTGKSNYVTIKEV